ncbi:ATP-binding protein [Tenacibaculum finnmarkense genomovar ulcerans]|uniref:AAA family ATPase n=1 Tax=Tenacibaculum finnmarkense TaxID=2781243 RepID=UPI00187B21F9|nr:ATP-binding protein [Tenacibaculum finnmarkense]MBE7634014.1 AAA family ATPase [Tenacibaculum finnmarkense genomovar ulcerans]MBE7647683.1 AAA family ATPase [Tenacibaculum finnmarkense genomovar ulcerans]MCD8429771.1 ATP-binding protein [Tenacibaculum finnmarkense genomovar ulcerans]MCD8432257.1 ATP-binding protein [Tenacibaculum finnmarkense genomovar ulcerans]
MITKFSVSNFKGFSQEFTFDLQNTNGYNFNKTSIKNGIVNNALIYGHNGVGKSNLGLAIFDIVGHLTDKNINKNDYNFYLNADNDSDIAIFHYEFLFNNNTVVYEYEKKDSKTIVAERFFINNREFASIDKRISEFAEIKFQGTENLKKELTNNNLSLLKYIKNNSLLDQNNDNSTLLEFYDFVDKMLLFRSLEDKKYIGLEVGAISVQQDIINRENVSNLELFLNKAGIECNLNVIEEFDNDILTFKFGNKNVPFAEIASQGTKSLAIFYFWLQRLREESVVSFLFIDEFDAFYHHELSEIIIEELKKTGVQFILTTHNTSVMSNDLLRPDCYFLMYKDTIKSLAKSTRKELREAHNIEKMYKAGSFDV